MRVIDEMRAAKKRMKEEEARRARQRIEEAKKAKEDSMNKIRSDFYHKEEMEADKTNLMRLSLLLRPVIQNNPK